MVYKCIIVPHTDSNRGPTDYKSEVLGFCSAASTNFDTNPQQSVDSHFYSYIFEHLTNILKCFQFQKVNVWSIKLHREEPISDNAQLL